MKLIILLLVAFIALVNGHAVLVKPTPFSSNPSTASPCGAGVPQVTNILGTVCRNSVNKFRWEIVVEDGKGKVTFSLSSNNQASNFDILIGTSNENPTNKGTYDLTVTAPATLKLGKYLMKANSSSNWNSCSFVEVTDDCDVVLPPTVQAVKIEQTSGVTFCSDKVQKKVIVPIGTVLADYDELVLSVYDRNMANINVIGTNTSQCGEDYKEVLCDVSYPLSSGTNATEPVYTVTYEQCQQFVKTCGVETHLNLYPCDMFGSSNSASFSKVSTLLSILVLSIALLL